VGCRAAAPTFNGSKRDIGRCRSATHTAPAGRADNKGWLLERFPELAATLAHLDRCDDQIAVLTVGTGTEDVGR
jgi:hypothetical protein